MSLMRAGSVGWRLYRQYVCVRASRCLHGAVASLAVRKPLHAPPVPRDLLQGCPVLQAASTRWYSVELDDVRFTWRVASGCEVYMLGGFRLDGVRFTWRVASGCEVYMLGGFRLDGVRFTWRVASGCEVYMLGGFRLDGVRFTWRVASGCEVYMLGGFRLDGVRFTWRVASGCEVYMLGGFRLDGVRFTWRVASGCEVYMLGGFRLDGVRFTWRVVWLDEVRFEQVSDETLESLTESLEEAVARDAAPQDCDVLYSTGVLTLQLGTFGTYVINKQTPNKQIWLSSPVSGPKRFDFVGGAWVYRRTGDTLHGLLGAELSKVFSSPVDLLGCAFGRSEAA
ncbi:Frataxin, mitochondrial [Chionoecetes opilio]|uniref:ferroxidase n=1 Tax=Chionoecetes opilio TaxID=41210 RepID=A0A8J4XLP7_CHIOP|nr:Frataxin, mitochondrial [Chionoecetes opilio]